MTKNTTRARWPTGISLQNWRALTAAPDDTENQIESQDRTARPRDRDKQPSHRRKPSPLKRAG